MSLTIEQKQHMLDHGYVKLPGIIPKELVHAALKGINMSLGQNGIDPARLNEFRSQTYCPESRSEPFITDLYNQTPLREAAEALIGGIKPVGGGQIALRFPTPGEPRIYGPHIDGTYSPTNGVPQGELSSFTALAAVFLSDLPQPFSGNFAVWPGSHRTLEGYLREHGPETLIPGMPKIDLAEPVQITGAAGDAVIAHHGLAHSVTGNASPFTRYAIFFRLHHLQHHELKWQCLTDIWLEWPGIREVAQSAGEVPAQQS